MIFRPQFQFRFRDEAQFIRVKQLADNEHLSVNEYLVRAVESRMASAPGATAPGQVENGAEGGPEKKSRAAAPQREDKVPRHKGKATGLTMKPRSAGITTMVVDAIGAGERIAEAGFTNEADSYGADPVPLSALVGLCEDQPLREPVEKPVDAVEKSGEAAIAPYWERLTLESASWTDAQWCEHEEKERIDPDTGAQFPNSAFCPLQKTNSCNRYNVHGGHCLRCR